MNDIRMVPIHHAERPCDISDFDRAAAERVRAFHRRLPGYAETPLYDLGGLASALGIKGFLG